MNKYYITFGQVHAHSVNGKTFDKDCVAEIEAPTQEDAHKAAMRIFNGVFHRCMDAEYIEKWLKYYPRGIIKL